MIPMSLGLVVVTAIIIYFWGPTQPYPMRLDGRISLVLLGANALVLLVSMWASMVLPPPPATNRKIPVPGSRFALSSRR